MSPRRVALALVLAVALPGCATGSAYPQLASSWPPLGPGQARIVLYMTTYSELPTYRPVPTLDGAAAGTLHAGTFLAFERQAGPHTIGIQPDPDLTAFGNEASTPPLTLTLGSGATAYVQVSALAVGSQVSVTLTPEDAATGLRDLSTLTAAAPRPPD